MKRKNNIVSYRTCLFTNKQYDKTELTRLVKVKGELVLDKNQNLPGRGYWIKLTDETLNNPKLLQVLSKRTKCNVNDNLLEQLKLWKAKTK